MDNKKTEYQSIDEYIQSFPESIQKKLVELRAVIKEEAPQAQEKISWQMPTFYLNGNLVHFAAHSKHIGFYPGASGIDAYKSEFSNNKYAKGSVQFPNEEPLPIELIKKIVRFRVSENLAAQKKK